ncbi:hypothetical protein F4779DRAFT_221871 [Xylariaceae sp. FL0662B]|nr:hypothetical protein F4779DRAFT_221871 [Xylariaceae sp. FL0662B]
MIYKKFTIALCSSSSLPASISPLHVSSSRNSSPRWPRGGREPSGSLTEFNSGLRHASFSRRCYASVSDGPTKPSSSSGRHDWPSSPNPTPYEIFGQHKNSPYSKSKFYTLVKIYHPDRHRHASTHKLPHSVRLERYRLIVAANEILRDPVKRREYDRYGAGWGGNLRMENLYRKADRSWRDEPGNPSMNATWEDWERWYDQREGGKEKQRPIYMSNELFVGVVCAFAVIGSMGQARWGSSSSMNLVERRDQKHAAISQDMKRQQHEQVGLNRHGRIEGFLRQRDSWSLASSLGPHDTEFSDSK